MAENGVGTSGEQRRVPAAMFDQGLRADRIDLGLDGVKTAALESIADGRGAEADPEELIAGDHPVLPASQACQTVLALDRTWVAAVMLNVI